MGVNAKIGKQYYPQYPQVKVTICNKHLTGKLCDPQAETFLDRCTICNKPG